MAGVWDRHGKDRGRYNCSRRGRERVEGFALMKLLLDTQTWVWWILEPSSITSKAKAELENPENELWLSPVSIWELLVLARKKRLVLQPNAEEWVRHWLRERPLLEAPLS